VIETVSFVSYHDYKQQGLEGFEKLDQGARILVVDDLVDTGATAKVVREMLPKAHFATIYAKPSAGPGRPCHHRSVKGHLDRLTQGHGPRLPTGDRACIVRSGGGPVTSEDLVAANAKAAGHADDGHGGVYFPDGVYQGGTVVLTKGGPDVRTFWRFPLGRMETPMPRFRPIPMDTPIRR